MAQQPIQRILVANRGEIAVRIIRACRELGIESVAVFSEVDREALHVRFADRALPIGPAPAAESYLDIDRVLEAARRSGADALHPGYGFLSENPELARRCAAAGLTFIGPTAECMALVGDKAAARQTAVDAGVPVVPGTPDPVADAGAARRAAADLGYPVMLKAAAGGGGKGMRLVGSESELASAFAMAGGEARSAFGDDRIYIEKAIVQPRHVEIQILADVHGNRIHLGERECTLQRRHQKVLEEAPSPVVDAALRERMGEAALAVAASAGYSNAGTVEFLLDAERDFFFIEVNARLQVEHPVTEMLTGVDLVAEQIALAQGERLSLRQQDVELRGHAIECRIYAEDPDNDFAPSPGVVEAVRIPAGPGVRDDSCLFEGYEVPIHYDPLVGKLIAWGVDRPAAIRRMRRALGEYKVRGIATTIPLHQRVLADDDFAAGRFDTGYLDRLLRSARDAGRGAAAAEAGAGPEPAAAGAAAEPGGDRHAEIARIAAAVHVFLGAEQRSFRPPSTAASAWKLAGRAAALDGERSAGRGLPDGAR
ncbi:MAG TPA: acetyl-CoA carboxylase biotin carboxylase subunit [Acidobacteriota bacterium]